MLQCDDQPCKFDFEKESLVSVKVKVTDSGSPPLTFVETLTLEVIDENDPPQDLRLVGESIVENSPPGTIIGAHVLNHFITPFLGHLSKLSVFVRRRASCDVRRVSCVNNLHF